MIVSNSSPLINLSAIGEFNLLQELFGEIFIPSAVWDEVVIKGKGQPGAEEIKNAKWVKKELVANMSLVEILTLNLGKGKQRR